MIKFRSGDMFKSPADATVVTTNCQGVMGAGIALQCKRKHHSVYERYKTLCKNNQVSPGDVRLIRPQGIVLFFTKDDWRNKSKLAWIDSGLARLAKGIVSQNIKSINIPPLGCGLGGLKWYDVLELIIKHLSVPELEDVLINIFPPKTSVSALKE